MARRPHPPSRFERLQILLDTRLGHVLVRVTVAALVFLLAGIVMRQARAYTYRMQAFRLSAETLAFVELPAWADGSIHATLKPKMFEPLSVSIYDPEAEATVKARVERHPLIRTVEEVRLLYPNRARVRPVLRVPVAQVAVWVDGPGRRQVQRWRLLSDDGCLLPRSPYRAYLEGLPYVLPVVTGITEQAPHDPGEVWEDRTERVKEAVASAKLAGRLHRDFSGWLAVTRIDVSRFPAENARRDLGEVRLVISCPPATRGGPRVERTVEWGRTERARDEVSYEDRYSKKVERLRRLLKPGAPRWLDVRYDLPARGRTGP